MVLYWGYLLLEAMCFELFWGGFHHAMVKRSYSSYCCLTVPSDH